MILEIYYIPFNCSSLSQRLLEICNLAVIEYIISFNCSSLSQRLLEICNLADIERKLDLYKAMFYTNTESDRDANFITSESLKIELIAGGLNWKQQKYIMEKMEPNDFGDVSFLTLVHNLSNQLVMLKLRGRLLCIFISFKIKPV